MSQRIAEKVIMRAKQKLEQYRLGKIDLDPRTIEKLEDTIAKAVDHIEDERKERRFK